MVSMFSYEQIARWLPFSIDPITVEDWIGNREIFGPDGEVPKEFEYAYVAEQIRSGEYSGDLTDLPLEILLNSSQLVGIVEKGEEVVVAPAGVVPNGVAFTVEVSVDADKPKKLDVPSGNIAVLSVDSTSQVKLKIWCKGKLNFAGKNEASWIGSGRKNIIFDGRGNPVPTFDLETQNKLMKTLFERKNE